MPNTPLEADNSSIEAKLLEVTNNDTALVKKLLALGEPFKRACRALGYNVKNENTGNPILAFLLQQKNLVHSGYIKENTFKAIYNAVAKKLVADSEFFTENDYNIIYYKNLYKKTPKEIEEYLILQSEILKPYAEKYSVQDQEKNRKVFLYIQGVDNGRGEEELNIIKRAVKINNSKNKYSIPTVKTATKLNSIDLAKEINRKSSTAQALRSADELDKIVTKLKNLESKFAAILMLCTSNAEATKKALSSPEFSELTQKRIANAFMVLSQDETLPKEPLRKDVATLLIKKILATLKSEENT